MSIAISGYVLAGGESSRMQQRGLPRDKALLQLSDETLLQRALRSVEAVCGNATVLCGSPERCARLGTGFRAVMDIIGGCGPLGGLHAALYDAAGEWLLVVPVDLPLLPEQGLGILVEQGRASGAGVTCFLAGGRVQPLPVVLHRSARPMVEAAIKDGQHKLLPVLQQAAKIMNRRGICVVPINELGRAVLPEDWFRNVNTPEDYRQVIQQHSRGNGLAAGASE